MFYKTIVLIFIALSIAYSQSSFHSEKIEIMKVLMDQEAAWNKGSIEQYMFGYWNSDSLRFIGSKGIQYSWQNTFDGYQKSYPDKATMGQLKFDIISVEQLSEKKALMIGKWHLTRDKGNIGGHFTLIWQKFEEGWRIVLDHTS